MIILKIGGGTSINWQYVSRDLKSLLEHEKVIVVHGAGAIRDEIGQQLQSPTKTITSPSGVPSVFTDQRALEIFTMVYPGLVNTRVVAQLQAFGISAVGLSGVDGALWRAKRKPNLMAQQGGKTLLMSGNYTGRVESINTHLLQLLLDNGYTPVVSPPALSDENEVLNTDNDWAVAVMAGALSVKTLVYLFEAPGLLENHLNPASLIKHVCATDLDQYLSVAQGRMKKKLLGAKEAFRLGVETVYFGDGRIESPFSSALSGNGTTITNT